MRNTRALDEITIFLRLAMAGVTLAGSILKAGKRMSLAFQKRTLYRMTAEERWAASLCYAC